MISNEAWDGIYKIGRTIKHPEIRLRNYQLYSPYRDYNLEYFVKYEDVYPVELWIHENYEQEQGEWYYGVLEEIKKDLDGLVGSDYVLSYRQD